MEVKWMNRRVLVTVLEVFGIVLVVIGVSSWSLAAGLVAAGIALTGIGYLLE
jgi:hypothetical protein